MICFRAAADLSGSTLSSLSQANRITAILHQTRNCDKFTEWQTGLTPKEHYEMMVSEKMLQIQRDREDADRNWREAEAETQRKWQARESQLSEERHRETIRVAVSANRGNIWSNALPGILGALATILAVYLGAYLATKNSSATTMPSQSAPIEQGSDWNASK